MSILRPGEFRITERALELCRLPEKAAVLDIGCGEGETIHYLTEKYGFQMSGIDLNLEMVRKAKEKNPSAAIQYADGEFLDDFTSFTFDCVMMECVLSLINMPDESLHEVYCVLKKGGKLVISDLYIRNPDEGLIKALEIEAQRRQNRPHEKGECSDDCAEEHKERPVTFRSGGRFVKEPLLQTLDEIGYKSVVFEDFSGELDNYVAQKLMDGGSLEGCFCGKDRNPRDMQKTGYFLLVAEKPL